jgi:hypothetical protein
MLSCLSEVHLFLKLIVLAKNHITITPTVLRFPYKKLNKEYAFLSSNENIL